MDFINSLLARADLFLMVVARVGGIFITAPLFSNRVIPRQVKIFFTFMLAIIVTVGINPKAPTVPQKMEQFVVLFIGEMMIGLIIGFVATLTFASVQLAGQLMDMQLGFGIVNVIDPIYGVQAPLMGSFQNILALLLFLSTNSHYYLISALYESYHVIPIFGFTARPEATGLMVDLFGNMLLIGLKLAIPIVGALFVAEVALGLIARTMPEMQVYFVGMPAKITIGLILIIMVLPIYLTVLQSLFDTNYSDILKFINISR